MSEMCDKCGRGFGSARSVLVNGWELCASCETGAGALVLCPIGDLVGEPHEFAAGSGRLAFLDIMGVAGHVHEVCAGCAYPSSERVIVPELELIEKMIGILRLSGEVYTDGECLDLMAELLTANGFDVFPNLNGGLK